MALSELQELELEQLQREKNRRVRNSNKVPFLPRLGEVKQLQKERISATETFVEELKTPAKSSLDAIAIKPAVTAFKAATIPFQLAESALSSAGAAFQEGKLNPLEGKFNSLTVGRELLKGVTEKVSQYGDLVRTTGFGGILNEEIASSVGLIASFASGNFLTGGKAVKAIKGAKAASQSRKLFFFKQQSDKLNKGVENVFTAIRGEFKNIYNRIGKRPIGSDGRVSVQDIVTRNSDVVRKLIKREEKLGEAFFKPLGKGKQVVNADINTAKTVKTAIGEAVPKNVWSGIVDATEVQAQMMDDYFVLNNIIAKAAGKSSKELLALNAKFKRLHDFNRVIKSVTKKKVTGVTSTRLRKISESELQGELFEITEFSKEFLPQAMNIIKDINTVNRNIKIGKGAINVAKFGLGVTAAKKFVFDPLLDTISGSSGGSRFEGGG